MPCLSLYSCMYVRFVMLLLLNDCGCECRECNQPKMPVLFSMSHPLDEIAPVICRTGGMPATCYLAFFFSVLHCQITNSPAVDHGGFLA